MSVDSHISRLCPGNRGSPASTPIPEFVVKDGGVFDELSLNADGVFDSKSVGIPLDDYLSDYFPEFEVDDLIPMG